jgi:hypothetical protein
VKLVDIQVQPGDRYSNIDLEKLYGKKVKRIECSISSDFGDDTLVLQLHSIVFEDGTTEFIEGEHDLPYIPGDTLGATLKQLHDEFEE